MIILEKKKEYYSLIELEKLGLVDLKPRMLKYRMIKVKAKYRRLPEKLYKTGKQWNIHHSIIFEFDRKKLTKEENNSDFISLVTIAPIGNYTVKALYEVVSYAYALLSQNNSKINLRYFIEQGERGKINHIHFLINLGKEHYKAIKRASYHYINGNIDIRPVYEDRQLITYLHKEILIQGVFKSNIINSRKKYIEDSAKKLPSLPVAI